LEKDLAKYEKRERVNIGCGQKPTPGWFNYDNSFSVKLAKLKIISLILDKIKFLNEKQKNFIFFARRNNIMFADAKKRIPIPDNSVQVLYTSHMLEHLDARSVKSFLEEARRILVKGGIIRVVVPDLKKLVGRYWREGDADEFVRSTNLSRPRMDGLFEKVKFLVIGDRSRKWMYDGASLVNLPSSEGFQEVVQQEPGATMIWDPGHLDLHERCGQSVYVEGYNS